MASRTFLFGLVLMIGLLAYGNAQAQLETLVMPGKVISGHADIEKDCDSCHVKFERGKQTELCGACHEDVGSDIASEQGFHGKDRNAKRRECSYCHTDHEGRDANIVPLDESSFRHTTTDFPLIGKHDGLECTACHEPGSKHRTAPSTCSACHETDNPHDESVGTECGNCHSPTEWAEVTFDHAQTDFALIGKHETTACLACHTDHSFSETPTSCYSCHAEDDAHDGRSGQECGNCHQPTDWHDTSFNHARDTSFELLGKHGLLVCDDCHSDDPFSDTMDTACIACHRDDDNHEAHFGERCDTCHVPDGFVEVTFDHNVDTKHALHGAHVSVECSACHIEPLFEAKPLANCGDCHKDDDPHNATQGEMCGDCHNEEAWKENVFFDHDLTRFPLLGKHSEPDCIACHETQVFRDAPEYCSDCHTENDPHDDRFSDDCAMCHSPVDWAKWRFDHNTQTTFTLDGAHSSVSCDTCHRQSLDVQMRLGSRCSDCHASDDIHNGEFGADCGRCHSSDSFEEVQKIQ
jgi:hypothetical protein